MIQILIQIWIRIIYSLKFVFQDGFTISASILAKSKFYGNSTSAILEGEATVSLLPRGEEYVMTLPYAHCKGILMGMYILYLFIIIFSLFTFLSAICLLRTIFIILQVRWRWNWVEKSVLFVRKLDIPANWNLNLE